VNVEDQGLRFAGGFSLLRRSGLTAWVIAARQALKDAPELGRELMDKNRI
jgi:hypothetical protein